MTSDVSRWLYMKFARYLRCDLTQSQDEVLSYKSSRQNIFYVLLFYAAAHLRITQNTPYKVRLLGSFASDGYIFFRQTAPVS